jgi:hypothetical protein
MSITLATRTEFTRVCAQVSNRRFIMFQKPEYTSSFMLLGVLALLSGWLPSLISSGRTRDRVTSPSGAGVHRYLYGL